jgi:hypothetical protein
MHQMANQINLIRFLVFSFPIAFMSIRHGVHLALYGTLLLFIYELATSSGKSYWSKKSFLIFFSLSSIFIATALQQILAGNFNENAFDGPSRLLIAGIIFLYLRQKNIDYFRIIEISIPIGLVLLAVYLQINQKYFWGQRWANSFVDPNSLGSQATILSLICILTIDINSRKTINLLKLIGVLCGFYISINTESRGGWSTLPAMIICWLIIKFKEKSAFRLDKNQLKVIFITLSSLIVGVATLIVLNDVIHNRLSLTINEVTTWLKNPTIYSSAGTRLSMWVASTQLITENWIGYGDLVIKDIAAKHPLNFGIHQNGIKDLIQAGPHSDILSKGLSLGIFGIFSYFSLIFFPFFIFFKNVTASNFISSKAAQMGCIYISGVFISGLFNETLSLKYLCSFYGLMIACLAADVLRDNSHTTEFNGKAV